LGFNSKMVVNSLSRLAGRSFSVVAFLVASLVALPVAAVLWRALAPVSNDNLAHLLATVLPSYALTTALLGVSVVAMTLVLGISAAWIVAGYRFPGRAFIGVLMALPLAMPGFVLAYAYTDFLDISGPLQQSLRYLTGWQVGEYWFPAIRSLPGAALVLSLGLYPYIFMFARASFAARPAALTEAARSLGMPPWQAWWRVVLPVAWPSIAAGAALVLMETFADFGAVSHFAVDTLAAGVYRSWQGLGDQVSAARLAVLLVMVSALLLVLEKFSRRRSAYFTRNQRPASPTDLPGWKGYLLAFFCLFPPFFGFVLPLGILCFSWWRDLAPEASVWVQLTQSRAGYWTWNSAWMGSLAALATVPLALLVAYAHRLNDSRKLRFVSFFATSGYAFPGVILSIGLLVLSGLAQQWGLAWFAMGSSMAVLLWAYVTRFFAVAFQGAEAALTRVSPNMDASARSLGESPWGVLRRIHWPILSPALATSFALVFVDTLKELPATLILRPFNTDTLAVAAYQFAADERLSAAALPSVCIVLLALIPTVWLAQPKRYENHRPDAGA
jgi:iron(III) transport system permease protein